VKLLAVAAVVDLTVTQQTYGCSFVQCIRSNRNSHSSLPGRLDKYTRRNVDQGCFRDCDVEREQGQYVEKKCNTEVSQVYKSAPKLLILLSHFYLIFLPALHVSRRNERDINITAGKTIS
jgi:hypothetical protein